MAVWGRHIETWPAWERELQDELRRMNEVNAEISETEFETEDDEDAIEEILNLEDSPRQKVSRYWTPVYEARRQARKNAQRRPLSPPATPPHLKGRSPPKPDADVPTLQIDNAKVQKSKRPKRVSLRRPITRSSGIEQVMLHDSKGKVRYWNTPWSYVDLTFEQYQRDFNDEDISARYPEEYRAGILCHPTTQKAIAYHREQRSRVKRQNIAYGKLVEVPWGLSRYK